MTVTYAISPGRRLVFTTEALAKLQAHVQHTSGAPEAGGVLMGRHLLDSEDLVVDDITIPQLRDRQRRFSFFRSKRHSDIAREEWAAAKGRLAYLGTWHTHPEQDPTPSVVDKNDWKKAVAKDSFEGDRLFFPIIGIERMRVWSVSRSGVVEELQEVRR